MRRQNDFLESQKVAILTLYAHNCAACGCSDKDFLEVDHFIPISSGGTNDLENGIVLCGACNRAKGNIKIPLYYKLPPRKSVEYSAAMYDYIYINRRAFKKWLFLFTREKSPVSRIWWKCNAPA